MDLNIVHHIDITMNSSIVHKELDSSREKRSTSHRSHHSHHDENDREDDHDKNNRDDDDHDKNNRDDDHDYDDRHKHRSDHKDHDTHDDKYDDQHNRDDYKEILAELPSSEHYIVEDKGIEKSSLVTSNNARKVKTHSSAVLQRLENYLQPKNFVIIKTFSVDNLCAYILIRSNSNGDSLIISVPFKYSIPKVANSYELTQFSSGNAEERLIQTKDGESNYKNLSISGLEDDAQHLDPDEVDRLIDQYEAIDLDGEKIELLKDHISLCKRQLDRLKFCTSNIKYKLCILTDTCFGIINRSNIVETYILKKGIPSKNFSDKDIYFVLDLENFYEKSDTIHSDLSRVQSNLYTILGKAHQSQTSVISSHIRQYAQVESNLQSRYNKRDKYTAVIKQLISNLHSMQAEEKVLHKKIEHANKNKELSVAQDPSTTFQASKLQEDLTKIQQLQEGSITALAEIKNEYNNFVLEFDSILFDNIKLFNRITRNFAQVGITPLCKQKK